MEDQEERKKGTHKWQIMDGIPCSASQELLDPSSVCLSTFDFSRVDSVAEFTASFLLQGRSWYTKWITALEHQPVVTRFETLPFLDLGGFVNVNLMMDEDKWDVSRREEEQEVSIGGAVERSLLLDVIPMSALHVPSTRPDIHPLSFRCIPDISCYDKHHNLFNIFK